MFFTKRVFDKLPITNLLPYLPQRFCSNYPKKLNERKSWIGKRFGGIPEGCLGLQEDLPKMHWPNIIETAPLEDGRELKMQMIQNINESAAGIAQIYLRAIDELKGNLEYEWLHDKDKIIEKVNSQEYKIYGYYLDDILIGVGTIRMIVGQRAIQWVWGAVDPSYRGIGIWEAVGKYQDKVTKESGAQVGYLWVATTHTYSQKQIENVGYIPWGFFPAGELFGGSDGNYYRHSPVWYFKLYGAAAERMLPFDFLELTPSAKKIVDCVMSLLKEQKSIDEIENKNEKGPKP